MPYALLRFGLIPALFVVFGWWAWMSVVINSLVAEVMTNIHAFIAITPNHAGDDLPRFVGRSHDKAEFFLRQVSGSVNYTGGTDMGDFMQGYLNYQIEHHVFPDLPSNRYAEISVQVREICTRYGIPYTTGNFAVQYAKTLRTILKLSLPDKWLTATSDDAPETASEKKWQLRAA